MIRTHLRWISSVSSRAALAFICIVAASLMLFSAWREAPIMDELAHIPAGYGYVRYLDYRLNPEHPPLLKALSAMPLILEHFTFPTDDPAWTKDVNGQWEMGAKMLYGFGNNANAIVRASRIFPIILTLLLIMLVYQMARERLGNLWALLPATLAGMSPIILAHGHYVTTDVAATFGILLSVWRFTAFLEKPSRGNLWLAGLALGLAQTLKFSAVLLLPFFVGLVILHMWLRRTMPVKSYIQKFIFILLIGYLLIVYPIYGLFTFNYPPERQLSDTSQILASFGGGPSPEGGCAGARCLADLTVWASDKPFLRPLSQYALGVLMVMQRADGGNTAYFLGQVSAAGSRLYFPAVYLLKETLPALILIFGGMLLAVRNIIRSAFRKRMYTDFREYARNFFPEISWLLFALFYWAYSMKSPLNIGVRHILPTIPLFYLLAASAWKRWVSNFHIRHDSDPIDFIRSAAKALGRAWLKSALLLGIILWSFIEAAVAAPDFLPYFNELAGGTRNGYRYVTDSNYDWGQDLLYLEEALRNEPSIQKIAVDYFGGGNPAYYLGDKAVPWNSAKGHPREAGIEWLAVSVNSLQNATQPAAPGYFRKPEDTYSWLSALRPKQPGMGGIPEPDRMIGTSIALYHLPL